ncbi:MAG TPA: glycosyltransferase family 2 protein [Candidatus Saccharimonadales bacterium]|nr:glycosyltransferase family 2 protein [Candidatus Saccharimonadales bacterium]
MKKVFAVAINFNKEDVTFAWLDSIQKVKTPNFTLDIVIVDNASTKPFVLNKERKKDNVHVIRNEENTGFTGGNNIGMQYALDHGAEYLLIINNDTIVDVNLIHNLLTVLDSDPKIGLTTSKIYFAKGHEFHKDRYKKEDLGKVFWYAGGYTDWANVRSVHRGVDEVDHGQYDTAEKIDFASGCCMLIKREVLEKVGLFDKRGFMYYEDAILCERIKKAGYELWYVPSAVLWHVNAASSGGSGNQLQDYFLTRNQMLFGMMYAPIRSKIALIRQSIRYLLTGRSKQKQGIKDFYLGHFGKGTYFDK